MVAIPENVDIYIELIIDFIMKKEYDEKEALCEIVNMLNKKDIQLLQMIKEYRNNGNGSLVLKLLEDEVIRLRKHVELVGLVKKDNIASYNRFVRSGYRIKEYPDYYEFRKEIREANI